MIGALGGAFLGGLFSWLTTRTNAKAAHIRDREMYWTNQRRELYIELCHAASKFKDDIGPVARLWNESPELVEFDAVRDTIDQLTHDPALDAKVAMYAGSEVRKRYNQLKTSGWYYAALAANLRSRPSGLDRAADAEKEISELSVVEGNIELLTSAIRNDLRVPD